MEPTQQADVTRILVAIRDGDREASDRLLPLVYQELRNLARSRMARTPPGQTLQPTALVHEAYLRLIGSADAGWDGRGHFFGAAARAMRDILVDQARRKGSLKRGGDRNRVPLDHVAPEFETNADEVLALDEALRKLEVEDPEKAELVMLRYFAGLTAKETAELLGVSLGTVERRWRFVRAWLRNALST
jgi:RNA polymerase sigma factor (TIGR02999 family)